MCLWRHFTLFISKLENPHKSFSSTELYDIISDRNFIIANAQMPQKPVIFCNDGFCQLTGYGRAETMQKPAYCDFLHGPLTAPFAIKFIQEAVEGTEEKQIQITYYRKNGETLTPSFTLFFNNICKPLTS